MDGSLWSELEVSCDFHADLNHRYILCDTHDYSAEGFWNALRNSLPQNTSDISLETLLLSHWPYLKAVIGRVGAVNSDISPPMHPVWILAENALEPNRKTHREENPIGTILRLRHSRYASYIATEKSPEPHFWTQHQFESAIDTKALSRTTSSRVIPDAILSDKPMLGLDFYIVESRTRSGNKLPGMDKSRWLWRLCCLSRAVVQNPFFFSVACQRWFRVINWLYLVGPPKHFKCVVTDPRSLKIGVNDQAFMSRPSNTGLAPFELRVPFPSYPNFADFTDSVAHIQRELTRIMKGERRASGIVERNLPYRLIIDLSTTPLYLNRIASTPRST